MESLFTTLCSAETLRRGWEHVLENQGCPGFDGESVEAFGDGLEENISALSTELESATYQPLPYRRGFLGKEDGDQRPIVIPAVRDRVVQEALLLLLTPIFEPDFLNCSFAYRPGRSTSQALAEVQRAISHGKEWILCGDIEAFFDRIDHDLLSEFLREKLTDTRILDLTLLFLKAPVMDGMRVEVPRAGVPQGNPLSPLLANVYLLPFDRSLVKGGYQVIRFADDFVVLGSQEEECKKARECAKEALARLRLTLHPDKTSIRHVKDGFTFLGYHIDLDGRGPSKKALTAIESRLESAAKENELLPLSERLEKLDRILRGWFAYFGTLTGLRPRTLPVLLSLLRVCLEQDDKRLGGKLLREAKDSFPEVVRDVEARAELHRLAAQMGLGGEVGLVHDKQRTPLSKELGPEPLGASRDEDTATVDSALTRFGEPQTPGAPPAAPASPAGPVHGVSPIPAVLPGATAGGADPYASISRLRQLLKNQPDYAEGYRHLAESYVAIGQFGLAKKAYERALEIAPAIADATEERFRILQTVASQPVPMALTEAEVNRFLVLFSGREGVYARQWVDEQGRRGFSPMAGNLDLGVVRKHVTGEETLGVYQILRDSTVHFLVLDVDVDKRILLEAASNQTRLNELDRLTQIDASRIVATCSKLGVPAFIEDSGYKGRHCWVFFDDPVPARLIRQFARVVIEQTGPPSAGVHWEIFPNQDKVREDKLGCLVKLPLGIHKRTGRRCLLVDPDGHAYDDQGKCLMSITAGCRDVLNRVVALARKGGEESGADGLEAPTRQIAAVMGGCGIVRYLVNKARDVNYLTHRERLTLLYTLGHLGDEGKAYLVRIMAKTINYNSKITEKYVRRMKDYPISCPRIREAHEELLGIVQCNCEFKLPPRGYPSPVLHAFRAKGMAVTRTPTALRRKAEGVGASGVQQQIEVSATAVLQHEGMPPPASDACAPGATSIRDEVSRLLATYLDLKQKRSALAIEIEQYETRLLALFTQAGVESLRTDLGLLRKEQKGDKTSWLIEL